MKRILLFILAAAFIASCSNSGGGELVGVQGRKPFYQPMPFGMTYVPMGSFVMGAGDEDPLNQFIFEPRTVTVSAFFMDETEITNNEYRQFVYWVRDSIARTLLGDVNPEAYLVEENKKTGEVYDPPFLNWKSKIKWDGEEERDALEELFIPESERYFRVKQIDARKLSYKYFWVDINAAAKKNYSTQGEPKLGAWTNRSQQYTDRSVYVREEEVNIYPDTLCWLYDYSYSYNEPMAENYFWHPAYDNYPVVGVSWKQAKAFSVWRTQLRNNNGGKKSGAQFSEYRLPTETEWEWAARGGHELNPYPWGGPYPRNDRGCFLGNFKPNRGDYIGDGGATTIIVAHYPANDWGLYDMAGNVSEWTNDAYDPSSYNFTWDMNPAYTYNAKDEELPTMKRKVIRGGSWKDVSYFIKVFARGYEFQDTAKSYIGFRCVESYLGRQKDDNPAKASHIYKR